MKNKILIIFGTRPEFLKLYPLIIALKKKKFKFDILNTGQHFELIKDQNFFMKNLKYKNLNLMNKAKNLDELFFIIQKKVSIYLKKKKPDLIVVQGDTTTAVASAIAAAYNKIKIAHIEAGLRTFDISNPFPEELNRLLISKIANYHFAPTYTAYKNLINENVEKKKIFITGNTVVDLIRINKKYIKNNNYNNVLCTIHRRENFGKNLRIICKNIEYLSKKFPKLNFKFVAHPNQNIKKFLPKYIKSTKNLTIISPLNFLDTLNYIFSAKAIITDSGGIQEEVTTLNKYCLVVRKKTERIESIKSKNCILTDLKRKNFVNNFQKTLYRNNKNIKKNFSLNKVFGDGYASDKILKVLKAL
jgi:UDP-N-acetylglucosamine 2-epimerase (non-hydrolysing)